MIETKRLRLEKYIESNLNDYKKLKNCPDIWKYSTFDPVFDEETIAHLLMETIAFYEKNQYGFLALYEKESNQYIGEAGILSISKANNRCVIGYNILPEFWNQGYATEVSKELINYAFSELKAHRVEALAMEGNIASCRVLEKTGLKREGILKHFAKIKDTYINVVYFGLLREDYYNEL